MVSGQQRMHELVMIGCQTCPQLADKVDAGESCILGIPKTEIQHLKKYILSLFQVQAKVRLMHTYYAVTLSPPNCPLL